MPKIIDQNHLGSRNFYTMTYQLESGRWGFEAHTHSRICDLTYLKSGHLNQTINGRNCSFSSGELIWIREKDLHQLSSRKLEMYNINFHESELLKIASVIYKRSECEKLLRQKNTPHIKIPSAGRASFESQLHQLLTEQNNQNSSTLFHRFLFNTFADYILAMAQDNSIPAIPQWLSECSDYIDRNLQQELSPAILTEFCGKSREHISRSFKKYLGVSLSQYISQRKLELASILLTNTNRDILDICFSLGFNSPSYFYRQFKQRYGMPPLAYRKEKSPLYSGDIF